MPLRLPLLLLFLCGVLRAGAQTYEPGWLLPSTGDTLRGEIENGFWKEPPAFIRYRPAAGSPSQLFQPRQLRAVGLRGGRYFRYETLAVDHAAQTRLTALQRGLYTDVHTDSLLAEVLVEGPLTLLRAAWTDATHYFLLRPGQPVLELADRKYLRQTPEGAWVISDGNNYRGQLGAYFRDCPAAFGAVQAASFTARDLTAVVLTYNAACGPAQAPSRNWLAQSSPRRHMALRGGVLAGLRYNRIESNHLALGNACTDCSPHPFAGLYADLLQPSRTTAIYGELSLSRFQNRSIVNYFTGEAATYRAWLGTARLGARYFYPLPREQQLLFGFGYELNWVLAPRLTGTAPAVTTEDGFAYASPTLLPHFAVGWRRQRLTFSLDAQSYISASDNGWQAVLVGSGFALRLGTAYQLGRNPDDIARR